MKPNLESELPNEARQRRARFVPFVTSWFNPARASLRISQLKRVVHDLQGPGAVFLVDDAADLDLAGGDVLDVDLRVGEGLEHALGDAGVDAHADADDAHLGQVAVEGRLRLGAQLADDLVDDGLDVAQIAVLDGEADVRRVVVHHVLDDVVHDDVRRGDVAEDLGGDAGSVRDVLDRHPRQVLLEGRARYDDVLHVRRLRDDPGPLVVVLAVAHVDGDVVLLGELHRPRLQHARPKPGNFELPALVVG